MCFVNIWMQICLAVDADAAGETLANELARRLGRNKCKITKWPRDWRDHEVHLESIEAERRFQEHSEVCHVS
jgi:5S rRNA maturation endonuclease (ribonuclease M5)